MKSVIKGLSHITFICKDLEKSAQLFKTVFEAEEIYDSGDQTFSNSKEKFFNLSGVWIAIMEGTSIEKTYITMLRFWLPMKIWLSLKNEYTT